MSAAASSRTPGMKNLSPLLKKISRLRILVIGETPSLVESVDSNTSTAGHLP